jgi:hypothetical protein
MPTGYTRFDLYNGEGAERIRSMYTTGLKCATIAELLDCSCSTIERVLIRLGITRHGMTGYQHTEAAKASISEANSSRIPGDKWYTTDGYVYIYQPEHPHANSDGNVREHRLVMESIIGRYLLPTEVVHHINELKDDNSPGNLQLFESASAHSAHHARLRNESVA